MKNIQMVELNAEEYAGGVLVKSNIGFGIAFVVGGKLEATPGGYFIRDANGELLVSVLKNTFVDTG